MGARACPLGGAQRNTLRAMTTDDRATPGPTEGKVTDGSALGGPADVARRCAVELARMLSDDKCDDVTILDVQHLSQVSDYIVIASGSSDRQMRSSAQHVMEGAESFGCPVYRHSVDEATTWFVVDCVDVVVHIFEPNTRAHYDLELLWGDAPQVPWEREPDSRRRDRAGISGLTPKGAAQRRREGEA